MRETDYRLKEIQTRFIYPFFFDQWQVNKACELLQAARFTRPGSQGQGQQMWECTAASGVYLDEMLEHVARFLFTSDSNVCRYLKLSGHVFNEMLHHHVTVQLSNGSELSIKAAKVGVELFLMAYGMGVLSIALTPVRDDISINEAVEFNYRLARYDPMPAAPLSIPYPAEVFQKKSASGEPSFPHAPAPDAPIEQRIGALGGSFKMPELIEFLLEPLAPLARGRVQQGLSVYTVVRLEANADFGTLRTREELSPFLSALAQIEESDHAGATRGVITISNEVLNTKHWAAVGLLGAAHLVADQRIGDGDKEHPFNEQRLPRVRDKYFVPYLMALFQRLFLERTIREAGSQIDLSFDSEARRFLPNLRHEIERAAGETMARLLKKHSFPAIFKDEMEREVKAAVEQTIRGHEQALVTTETAKSGCRLVRFLREDLDRSLSEAFERMPSQARMRAKYFRRHSESEITDAIDRVFSQDRYLARLREDILQFAVQGHFTQVSSRQVLHHFYRIAQDGLDVPQAWAEVNYAISNLDRQLATEREYRTAKNTSDNLAVISRVQRIVHVLEYLVIGTYAVEVFHIASTSFHEFHTFESIAYPLLAFLFGLFVVFLFDTIERNRN